jgi:ATP-dependent helicase HrpA
MRHEAAGITTDAFPPQLTHRGQSFKLAYHHDPGAADDGVTLTLPLAALNQLPANRCEWLVPGLLKEKVVALLKTVQQKYRHRLQPLDEFTDRFCDAEHDRDEPLVRALTRAAEEHMAQKLPLDAFRTGELRPHLFMNFRLVDEHGGTLAMSRNLAELRAQFRDRVEQAYAAAEIMHEAAEEGTGATEWKFGTLPELLEVKVMRSGIHSDGAGTTVGFPALVDLGESVRLTAFDTEDKARAEHRKGLSRLFALQLAAQVKAIEKLPGLRELALQFIALGTEKELREQLVAVTLERTCLMDPLPDQESAFAARREAARGRILLVAQEILRLVGTVLTEYAALTKKLGGMQKAFPQAAADIGAQLAELMPKKFILATPFERLQHYPRYLKAIALRLDKARNDPVRDTRLMADWQALGKPWERERNATLKSGQPQDAFLDEFRWLLEELRVALFAQELKTSSPVSVKRLQKMWDSRERR